MYTTVKYILLTALRDWLFAGLFVGIFVAYGVSVFLGGTAMVEDGQMKVVYIAGSSRGIILVGLIVFVCFHVRRAFDNREVEIMLSRPISRGTFVFAYWLGFSVVSVMLIIPFTSAVGIFLNVSVSGLLYWGGSLMLEAFLVVAFSLFASLMMRSAVASVLTCFAFYIISRMMGFFIIILHKPYLFSDLPFGGILVKVLFFISSLLPRLDLYAKSEWLVYGVAQDMSSATFIYQSLIFVPILLAMAVLDFKHRQF